MNKRYYVYAHRRTSDASVFYVGKGTWTTKKQFERAHAKDNRNVIWNRIVSKHGLTVETVMLFDEERDAFAMEIELIEFYGRIEFGGALCNLTEGGDGHSGYSPTEATRNKLRMAVTGSKHPNFGKKLSIETCRKKSESMKASPYSLSGKKLPKEWCDKIAAKKFGAMNPMYGKVSPQAKPVLDTTTGIIYPSVQAAADAIGCKMGTLWARLSGKNNVKTSMRYA